MHKFDCTIKLGYNDHGYNEIVAITNKNVPLFVPKLSLYYINVHVYHKDVFYNRVQLFYIYPILVFPISADHFNQL